MQPHRNGARTLVVGTYPPVPGVAAAATVAAVRRAWANEEDVRVASFRPSAAHLHAPVVGVLAGDRLRHMNNAGGGFNRLVLAFERGIPVPVVTGRPTVADLRQRWTVSRLCAALNGFDHITLLVIGDLGVPPARLTRVWPRAEEVIAVTEEDAEMLRRQYGIPPARVRVMAATPPEPAWATGEPWLGAAPARAVTPLGPPDTSLVERARPALGVVGRTIFGRHSPAVQSWVTRWYRVIGRATRRAMRSAIYRALP